MWIQSLGWEFSLEEEMATHSSILACDVHDVMDLVEKVVKKVVKKLGSKLQKESFPVYQ